MTDTAQNKSEQWSHTLSSAAATEVMPRHSCGSLTFEECSKTKPLQNRARARSGFQFLRATDPKRGLETEPGKRAQFQGQNCDPPCGGSWF